MYVCMWGLCPRRHLLCSVCVTTVVFHFCVQLFPFQQYNIRITLVNTEASKLPPRSLSRGATHSRVAVWFVCVCITRAFFLVSYQHRKMNRGETLFYLHIQCNIVLFFVSWFFLVMCVDSYLLYAIQVLSSWLLFYSFLLRELLEK
jgi:hypothetical protein